MWPQSTGSTSQTLLLPAVLLRCHQRSLPANGNGCWGQSPSASMVIAVRGVLLIGAMWFRAVWKHAACAHPQAGRCHVLSCHVCSMPACKHRFSSFFCELLFTQCVPEKPCCHGQLAVRCMLVLSAVSIHLLLLCVDAQCPPLAPHSATIQEPQNRACLQA